MPLQRTDFDNITLSPVLLKKSERGEWGLKLLSTPRPLVCTRLLVEQIKTYLDKAVGNFFA